MASDRTAAPPPGRQILVDINILPPELRPVGLTRLSLVFLGLSALGLVLFLFSFQMRWTAQMDVDDLKARLKAAQDTITRFSNAQQEASRLEGRISEAKARLKEIQDDYQAFRTQRLSWSAIMATIVDNAAGINFTSINLNQVEAKGVLQGTASSSDTVASYARSLVASNLFNRVTIRSISAKAPEALPTPTPGASPPTPAATLTPPPAPTPTRPAPTPTARPRTFNWDGEPTGGLISAPARRQAIPGQSPASADLISFVIELEVKVEK